MWAGLWQRKVYLIIFYYKDNNWQARIFFYIRFFLIQQAKYQETNIAIAYEQQGYFEQAQGAYELAMSKYRNDYNNGASPVALAQEIKLVNEIDLNSAYLVCTFDIKTKY